MVQTFKKRIDPLRLKALNVDLIVCDEAHRGEYQEICESAKSVFILGLTATPIASGKTPLNKYFDGICCPISIRELLSEGFIVPSRTYSINHDFSGLKIQGKDYSKQSLHKEFTKPDLFQGSVQQYLDRARGKKTIHYSANVELSKSKVEEYKKHGIKAVHVDGKTSRNDRKRIFEAFALGEFDILCNFNIATTGYDEPGCECIIKDYATLQLSKDQQCGGRGGRSHTFSDGRVKEEFITIDMGRNFVRHGLFGEEIDWERIYNNPKALKDAHKKNDKLLRECKQCGAIIKAKSDVCPYCLVKYTTADKEKHFIENAAVSEIKDYKQQTLPIHLRKKISLMNHQELCEYANHMGYNPGWVRIVKKKIIKNPGRVNLEDELHLDN